MLALLLPLLPPLVAGLLAWHAATVIGRAPRVAANDNAPRRLAPRYHAIPA